MIGRTAGDEIIADGKDADERQFNGLVKRPRQLERLRGLMAPAAIGARTRIVTLLAVIVFRRCRLRMSVASVQVATSNVFGCAGNRS